MTNQYIVQKWSSKRYTDLLETALIHGDCTHLDAAVAYATLSGVRVLERLFQDRLGANWDILKKRWLVGIDWCRSDPPALSRLDALAASAVRVPNGATLVGRNGCVPNVSYHPKLFMLRGRSSVAIICGSGNLSANGLTNGCEVGSVCIVNAASPTSHPQFANLQEWFQNAWDDADPYAALGAGYQSRCGALIKNRNSVPTDDDVKPPEEVPASRGLSEIQMRQLRTYNHFWIEGGSLGSNLGRGIPGNQLDMTRFTGCFSAFRRKMLSRTRS